MARDDGGAVDLLERLHDLRVVRAFEVRARLAPVEGYPRVLVHSPDRVLPGRACEPLGLQPLQRLSAEDPAGSRHFGRLPGLRRAVPAGEDCLELHCCVLSAHGSSRVRVCVQGGTLAVEPSPKGRGWAIPLAPHGMASGPLQLLRQMPDSTRQADVPDSILVWRMPDRPL